MTKMTSEGHTLLACAHFPNATFQFPLGFGDDEQSPPLAQVPLSPRTGSCPLRTVRTGPQQPGGWSKVPSAGRKQSCLAADLSFPHRACLPVLKTKPNRRNQAAHPSPQSKGRTNLNVHPQLTREAKCDLSK